MNRPTITHEMKLVAAKQIAEKLNGDADTIAKAYHYPMDGYELARVLDRMYYWDLTMPDVEALDHMDSLVRAELDKAEKQWAEQEAIEPPLPIGTHIKEGVIVGVYDHMAARFMVKENGDETEGRFLLVKFEDAIAV